MACIRTIQIILVLVLVALPLSVARAGAAEATTDVAIEDFAPRLILQSGSAGVGPERLVGEDEIACGPMAFTVQTSLLWIYEKESMGNTGDSASACGSARLALDIPSGATRVVLGFGHLLTDREGGEVPEDSVEFVLRIWDGAYAGELAPAPDRSRVVLEHDLHPTATVEPGMVAFDPSLIEGSSFVLEWWARDHGTETGVGDGRMTAGQAIDARIIDPVVVFEAVSAPMADPVAMGREVVAGLHRTEFFRDVDVTPPTGMNATTRSLQVSLPADAGRVSLATRDGSAVAASSFVVEAAEDRTVVLVGADVFRAHGNGTYRMTYTQDLPIEAVVQGHLWALPVLLAALVATGVHAWGRRDSVWRPDAGRLDVRSLVLPASLFVGTVAAVVALFVGDHYRFMATWPMPRLGVAYLAGFVIVALVGAALATHDRRRRLQNLEEAKASTETAAAELRMFLQGVTHDMKTPLIALRWLTDDLNDEIAHAADDEASRETLGRITQNVAGMERLVEDLLVLAEVETAEVETEAVAVPDVVAEVCRAVDEERVRRGAQVETTGGAVEVDVHAGHLRMALQNLVLNALKYGRQDGGQVRVSWQTDGDRVVFEVVDDGPGIPDGEKERVLAVFRRGTAAAESGERGTGLGLAIVAKAVERHGGRLEVSDAPEGGALFRFSMPHA